MEQLVAALRGCVLGDNMRDNEAFLAATFASEPLFFVPAILVLFLVIVSLTSQSVINDRSLDEDVRWMAATVLKNNVSSSYRIRPTQSAPWRHFD